MLFAWIVKKVFAWLATKNRIRNYTTETFNITVSLFAVNMVIYGLVPLLATADVRPDDEKRPNLEMFFRGIYYDFNAEWFQDVGVLVTKTMIFNIFMPPLETFFWLLWRYIKRVYDQGSLKIADPKKGKSKSIQQFTDLYSGQVFAIPFKYCYILTVVYIAFFFGAGLPILFPIACLSLFSLYITERLCMAYVYQRPPNYTTALNSTVLKILAFAPVSYVVVAAWVYSNQ